MMAEKNYVLTRDFLDNNRYLLLSMLATVQLMKCVE
jgi:hypothetical protein